jgi:hypothetical protein
VKLGWGRGDGPGRYVCNVLSKQTLNF